MRSDVDSLPGFAERKAEFLLKQINRVKKEGVFEKSLISSLNIPGIGDELANTISNKFSIYDRLSLCSRFDAIEIFSSIDGFSWERASELRRGLLANREYVRLFLKIIPLKYRPSTTDLFPSMKTVCLTGKFPENKSFYYEKLKNKGYTILEKVTDDLDLLVVADMRMRSGKQKSAEKKGIKMIDHNELMDLIGE
jgi:DNA ligase (NAD+)